MTRERSEAAVAALNDADRDLLMAERHNTFISDEAVAVLNRLDTTTGMTVTAWWSTDLTGTDPVRRMHPDFIAYLDQIAPQS